MAFSMSLGGTFSPFAFFTDRKLYIHNAGHAVLGYLGYLAGYEYGYSTYGGNSHLFADTDEGWVLINFAGGQGLWAAERLGSDDVRVSRPGYMGDFPVDFEDDPDYMAKVTVTE